MGGNSPITVDVRIVAATNRELETMVHQGHFRADLFYRLNVFPIKMPSLRERMEDIPLLVDHFLERHANLAGGKVLKFSHAALSAMMRYPWRGNIRELENIVRRAILTAEEDTIDSLDLPGQEAEPKRPASDREPPASAMPLKDYLSSITRDAEERYLRKALRESKGNVLQVARLMEVDRKTVYRKMTEYGIRPEDFRE